MKNSRTPVGASVGPQRRNRLRSAENWFSWNHLRVWARTTGAAYRGRPTHARIFSTRDVPFPPERILTGGKNGMRCTRSTFCVFADFRPFSPTNPYKSWPKKGLCVFFLFLHVPRPHSDQFSKPDPCGSPYLRRAKKSQKV